MGHWGKKGVWVEQAVQTGKSRSKHRMESLEFRGKILTLDFHGRKESLKVVEQDSDTMKEDLGEALSGQNGFSTFIVYPLNRLKKRGSERFICWPKSQ